MIVKTIEQHYRDATPGTRRAGGRWYAAARGHAERLAKRYGTTTETAAGIIAALSQRQRWQNNLALADACLAGAPVKSFRQCVKKAERIRGGEAPLDVLHGEKTRAFYRAIMGDEDAVVLDSWIIRVMVLGRMALTAKQYSAYAERLAAAARQAGTTPARYQATVWCQIRGGAT